MSRHGSASPSASGGSIACSGVSFSYGRRAVLHGVDLDVAAGEVVGLLGPNGSGKSTLIKVLSGTAAPYRGSAKVGGLEVGTASPRELARLAAVVQQEPVFAFPFSVLEVVLMGRAPHRSPFSLEGEIDLAAALEALERTGLETYASRPITELSSGERQRAVFARALAQEARVLLLDEPASFLDLRHQAELCDRVRELAAREGAAVLIVLHDLNLAARCCDRLALLAEGMIAAAGPPETVLTREVLAGVFGTELHIGADDVGCALVAPLCGRGRVAPEIDPRAPTSTLD